WDVPGRVDDERDVVVLGRQLGATAPLVGVIGDDDEKGSVEPGLGAGMVDELSDREVGVLDCTLAAGAGGNVDAPRGIRKGAVIRHGHDVREERLERGMTLVEFADREPEEVLVGHTPDVLEGDLPGLESGAVDDRIAVVREK